MICRSVGQCLQTSNEASTMLALESLLPMWNCLLSKEKFRNFHFEIEFWNKFLMWKGPYCSNLCYLVVHSFLRQRSWFSNMHESQQWSINVHTHTHTRTYIGTVVVVVALFIYRERSYYFTHLVSADLSSSQQLVRCSDLFHFTQFAVAATDQSPLPFIPPHLLVQGQPSWIQLNTHSHQLVLQYLSKFTEIYRFERRG